MTVDKTLFGKIMAVRPWDSIGPIVDRHGNTAGVRHMTCVERFRVVLFAQLTWHESLRDIEVALEFVQQPS